jgi:hypothetical protein
VTDNRLLAAVIACIPVSMLCLGYVVARRDRVARAFVEADRSASLSPGAAEALAFLIAASIGPGLGVAAAVAWGLLPSEGAYVVLAAALAAVLSVVALVSRTPLMVEKVVLNCAVAIALCVVAPRLAAG